ncbi:hypothetical protein T05_4268, partial [Trichinella murrelli]
LDANEQKKMLISIPFDDNFNIVVGRDDCILCIFVLHGIGMMTSYADDVVTFDQTSSFGKTTGNYLRCYFSNLTLLIVSGSLKSSPPCKRNPQIMDGSLRLIRTVTVSSAINIRIFTKKAYRKLSVHEMDVNKTRSF